VATTSVLRTCAHCATEFPQPPRTRGKVQTHCSSTCRVAGANARRATTRAGRRATYPRAVEPSTQSISPALTDIPSSVERSVSDSPRLSTLMAKAHSRGGINAWEIAELAKLRGRSPWAPLSVILAP
jgi:hypothetical protein